MIRRVLLLALPLPVVLAGVLGGQERGATAKSAERPPVVMIVFDEFPTVSLLDRHGRIDQKRYPNFAQLAHDAIWFSNATASVDETGRAVETLLTGSTPERKRPVTFEANPRNLFVLLGRRYELDASEEVTALCPRHLCPHVRPRTRTDILHELAHGRPERFARWVRSIRRRRRPTFFFKHVLFPHVPLRYLPSGHYYSRKAHEVIPGLVEAFFNRWLVEQAYQRHLLQLGFTDRLLGTVLSRLRRRGLYDRSLIVVTADNGESFGRFGNRHEISGRNSVDIALTPLFVKLPHERHGRIVRRHVRTVDVLPTIAHVLGLRVPWRTQGRSALGRSSRRIPSSVTMMQRSGNRFTLSFTTLRRRADAALRHKIRLFGAGDDSPGIFGIGPHPELLGTPVATWHIAKARHTRAALNGRRALASVRLRSGLVPVQVTGRIVGSRRRRTRAVAVVVNGWVTSTAPTFHFRGSRSELFSAMVPEAFLHEGANRVDVYEISSGRGGLRLVQLG
jgi:hypothetical protein